MKQLSDQKKLRMEYLKKKRKAIGIACAYFISGCAGLMAVYHIYPTLTNYDEGTGWSMFFFLVLIALISGYNVTRGTGKAIDKIARIPYVPPVIADNLPADEILVRGSDEPSVGQSDVLLRAAQQVQETAKEELLRVERSDEI
jgi:hypothetical protein